MMDDGCYLHNTVWTMHSDDLDVPIVSHLQTYMNSDDFRGKNNEIWVRKRMVTIRKDDEPRWILVHKKIQIQVDASK